MAAQVYVFFFSMRVRTFNLPYLCLTQLSFIFHRAIRTKPTASNVLLIIEWTYVCLNYF